MKNSVYKIKLNFAKLILFMNVSNNSTLESRIFLSSLKSNNEKVYTKKI